ncbi:MAG TPA: DEAD/DEAH box helicase [Candidatus Saccharimonadales bacterium]|nr:DEAD/DEAH box helicase [Candidatus Saccharimonadales bacterium]
MTYKNSHTSSKSSNYRSRRPFNRGSSSRRKPQKQTIDPRRFIRAAKPREEVVYTPTHTFEDFAVEELIKNNLTIKGFVQPSPIQDQAIPVGLDGKDIVGIANTGTGKTAAFAIPVLHKLITDKDSHALIVAPTRELAQQIEDECREIGKRSGIFGALLIGGSPMGRQLSDLRNKPQIVIGTPGRIKDHLERGSLKLDNFNMVVLDEVDRMLDMGFIPDMRFILDCLAPQRQSFFFSATMSREIETLIRTFLQDPVTISVKTGDTSENVEQNVVNYSGRADKIEKLHGVLNQDDVEKVLVFAETQRNVESLSNELQDRGFAADAIHGGKTQGQRERALRRFKNNDIRILVATDVAARGIDISDITHVINYSIPQAYEDYVHRIGRAGRAGRTGNALTFVEQRY